MAHTPGTPARTHRLIALLASCLLGVSTAMALGRVFVGAAASYRLMAAALLSALLACALERKNLPLATAASAAALLVAVGILIFPASTWRGLPTTETLRAIADASRLVGEQARLQVAPSVPLAPLMLAAFAATWAAVFSAHALAFRAGSPLLALLPPIALVAFADTVLEELIKPIYGVLFLAAALVVIFADGLRRLQGWGPIWTGPGRRARLSSTAGRSARRVALAAVSLAVMAPLLLPGFGSKALLDLSTSDGNGVSVDPLVSVANALQRDDPQDVFTVQTQVPTYYRFISLSTFDGAKWTYEQNPATIELPPDPSATSALAPEVIAGADTVAQSFELRSDLSQPWLPVAYPPTSVQLDHAATWTVESGTVGIDGSLDEGTAYTDTALLLRPSPDDLRALELQTAAQLPRYTDLPSDVPPQIDVIAHAWTEDATTPYDKIIAIQDHLRDEHVFTYDTNVPRRDDANALLDFLTVNPVGFCQQFASAMTVLLRDLGIPARVAVGFTSGTRSDAASDIWTVTTEDAHAWVEVLFPGYGWLPFEPTPSRSNPVASTYTSPAAVPCDRPGGCSGSGPRGGIGGKKNAEAGSIGKSASTNERENGRTGTLSPVTEGTPEPGSRFGGRELILLAVALTLLVLLLVPPVRAARRRRRLRRAGTDPRRLILATYDVFTEQAAEVGFPRAPAETLEEYGARVSASGLLSDGDLDRLTQITVSAAYARSGPGPGQAQEATEAVRKVLKDLRGGTPWTRRVRGRYLREG